MEKLTMCRICLVENVRMHKVTDRHLQETFEKLTHIAFITEDRRPMLACYFCYARLKQCSYFMMKCLEAEEMFAQMLDEDYEQKPVISQDTEFFGGFIKTTVDTINIVDVEPQVDSVKEELSIEYETDYDVGKIEVDDNNISDGSEFTKKHRLDILKKETPEDSTPNQQKEYGQANSTATDKTISSNSETVSKLKEPSISNLTQPKADDSIVFKETNNSQNTDNPCNNIDGMTDTEMCHKNIVFTTKKLYNCDLCQKCFTRNSHLKTHTLIHTGEKPYECNICRRIFNRNSHLKEHIRTHTREKPHKCNVCANSFSQISTLIRHKRTHTGEKPFKCHICWSSFKDRSNLQKHIRTHTGERPYECDICRKYFNQKVNLKAHNRRFHESDAKPYKCDTCQSSFTSEIKLSKHMIRTHLVEKPYKCDVCPSSFTQKGSLRDHVRIHTGENPYGCDVCQKSFKQKSNLMRHIRTHIRTHNGEKSRI